MGKMRDLSDFERGLIVGSRCAGSSISETASILGFSRTTVSRVYRDWFRDQKTSSQRQGCGRKRLVDEQGERRMEGLVEVDCMQTSSQITDQYNSRGGRQISHRTTRRTLKRLGFCFRTPRQDRQTDDRVPSGSGQTRTGTRH